MYKYIYIYIYIIYIYYIIYVCVYIYIYIYVYIYIIQKATKQVSKAPMPEPQSLADPKSSRPSPGASKEPLLF